MNTVKRWTQWTPTYDPRRVDGAAVTEDEYGRLIETADCGLRCPGCGICCAGYRDSVSGAYFGEEELEGNLKLGRYRVSHCGESCPGYGRCCPPFDLRRRPETVADARCILLERDDGQRWEMQEALLILAHAGSAEAVEVLEVYLLRAHTRLEGFAECALDEGRYFATVPRNAEEERAMLKREVLRAWEDRAVEAQAKIETETRPELDRRQYEMEIARRLLEKAQDDTTQETWQTQVDVLQMMIGMIEGDLAEQQEELALCEAMTAEIEADLATDQPG